MTLSLFAEPIPEAAPMRKPHILRARKAARILLAYSKGGEPPGREYDACFEMGDGAAVAAHLESLATKPEGLGGMPGLRAALRGTMAARYVSPGLLEKVTGTSPLFPETP